MKKQAVIYRKLPELPSATIRRYVREGNEEVIVELPDDMKLADAQYLAAQALAEAYIWQQMAQLTITTLRTLEEENHELEEGIEDLLSKLETYWNNNSTLEQRVPEIV